MPDTPAAILTNAQIGDRLPIRTVGPLTRIDFARFSIATDDPNRVHIEEKVAAEAGFPNVIGSGGIVTGLLTDLVSDWAGLASVRGASIRMFAPLVPDVVLSATGTVTARQADGSLTVAAELVDGDGRRIGAGEFRVAAK